MAKKGWETFQAETVLGLFQGNRLNLIPLKKSEYLLVMLYVILF